MLRRKDLKIKNKLKAGKIFRILLFNLIFNQIQIQNNIKSLTTVVKLEHERDIWAKGIKNGMV